MLTRLTFAITLLMAPTAHAETPRVVTSIAPLQGLVSDIMAGVGAPELLLDEPISPHDFAMRPSQAKAISDADILFYTGQHMEPWLEKSLQIGSTNGIAIALGELPDLTLLEARELDEFGEHHEDDDDDHDHDHEGAYDPHMWLDPANALKWLETITGILEVADPENQDIYRSNLAKSQADIIATLEQVQDGLIPLAETDLLITHDSIQYFENAFGLSVIGAFSASDGQIAGARSLNTLLDKLDPDTCVVEDLTHPSRIAANLPNNTKHITVDPMGYNLLGEGYYPRLLNTLAQSLQDCRD